MKHVTAMASRRRPTLIAVIFVAAIAAALPVSSPLAQDSIAGTYSIEGWDPGQDPTRDAPYRGTGTLKLHGDVYIYKGRMDGHDYTGVGIYDPRTEMFALHFKEGEGGRTGVALYHHSDGDLVGDWAWMDEADGKLGKETWSAE